MSLAALIRYGPTPSAEQTAAAVPATAIPATAATESGMGGNSVAKVATIAVANSTTNKYASSRHWRVYFGDGREPLEVIFSDDQTRAEVAARYPGAIEPVTETTRTATSWEVDELRRLIGIALADATAQERQEALAAAVRDVDDALASFRVLSADLSGPPATMKV